MLQVIGVLAVGVMAMVMHELGHLVAAWALGVRVRAVAAQWRGLCIVREPGSALQNLLVSLAGPAMNLALMAVPSASFRLANLCFLVCNLAPVRNSDGDRIMSCIRQLRGDQGMKRVLSVLVVALLAVAAAHGQTPPTGTDHGILTSWGTPVGTTQWPAVYCSATVTSACISGYTLTITPPSGVTGGSIPIALTGNTLSYSWKPGGALYCGTWGQSVVANWLDNTGKAVASVPLTSTVVEPCPFVASPASGPVSSSLIP